MRTSMTRLLLASLLLLVPVTVSAQTYTAVLNGANEVPPADPDGAGTATVVINGTLVTYTISVQNITLPPTGQHIHVGAAGVNGGILIPLTGTWVGGSLVGSTTAAAVDTAAIVANPAGHYVNVHTTDYPGGAIRGQLAFVSAATSIPTFSGGILLLLVAVLGVAGFIAVKK